jgi:hypothetical protein
MSAEWSAIVSNDSAYRRAAGRRAHNLRRQFAAATRRAEVARRLTRYGIGRGVRARIARELGVHPSTIGRDVRRILPPLGARSLPDQHQETGRW